MVNCVVTGAAGRMGRRIMELLIEHDGTDVSCATERPGHELIGMDIGDYLGLGNKGCTITDDFAKAISAGDVGIDFTFPEVSLANIRAAAATGKAMVVGSTGLKEEHLSEIRELAKKIPIVQSPNMSVGVNLLLKTLTEVARVLDDDYDVDIIETHHRHKKDSPSGTALKMAEVIAAARGRNLDDIAVYERHGMVGERKRGELGIQALRIGDVVGDHTVIFGNFGERIEITHKASSRDVFGRGAVRAAIWVASQKPGLYDMQDVLGIR
ncbi:MAG TPA: 4-hydroxy-tetrahydrodipicolinate reductase [Nitrospirota bacterium]